MKTIRVRRKDKLIVGFTNGFASYGKNYITNKYQLDINWLFGSSDAMKRIWSSSKRPIFRNINILGAFSLILSCVMFPFLVLYATGSTYINGAKNFYKDKAWVEDVREFNWMNIIIIAIQLVIIAILIIH